MITKEKAKKLYADLIQLRKSEILIKSKETIGQIEIHHILPRSCGGTDDESNKIALYAKEHFMAHVYLWTIYRNTDFHKQVVYALNNMIKGTKSGLRSKLRDFILASEDINLTIEIVSSSSLMIKSIFPYKSQLFKI